MLSYQENLALVELTADPEGVSLRAEVRMTLARVVANGRNGCKPDTRLFRLKQKVTRHLQDAEQRAEWLREAESTETDE